jgi:ubiquinone biosynthesis protein
VSPSDQAAAFLFLLGTLPGTGQRVAAVKAALTGPDRMKFRRALARWVAGLLPVERTVPEFYRSWRPVTRDAMMFVVTHLSADRLAPKIVEQMELDPATPPETRLIRLLARVPGLQKIGQVLARNRRLTGRLRRALSQLENGIQDVTAGEIREVIVRELGGHLERYRVRLADRILSEASVSAVVRFTWTNPATGRRERGVFKVLKPYVPGCYAEDMKILQRLAGHLAHRHRAGEVRLGGLSETLTEIRLLLEKEVDFRREQSNLVHAGPIYRAIPGIRVPHLIAELSTDCITALSEEKGVKVTAAFSRPVPSRVRVAERLAEALVALPAFAPEDRAVYHADPHAGNLLYDRRADNLVILDWALTEHLSRRQRRHVVLLVLHMLLRDAAGAATAIGNLCEDRRRGARETARIIRRHADEVVPNLPVFPLPGAMAAMRLLERIGLDGIAFPGALLMFRKATFTLEGVLADVAGTEIRIDTVVARYAARRCGESLRALASLLSPADWLALDWSALTFASRLCFQVFRHPGIVMPGA